MSVEAIWGRLVTIVAGRVGARLCWQSPLSRDRVAWHEAGHILAGRWEGVRAQSAALVEGGGIVSWEAGLQAASLRPGDVAKDARVARQLVAGIMTAAGVDHSWRAGLFLARAAAREADAGLRCEYLSLLRLAMALCRLGALTRSEIEAIRRASGAGRGFSPWARKAAGLPELEDLLAEARRRWPDGHLHSP